MSTRRRPVRRSGSVTARPQPVRARRRPLRDEQLARCERLAARLVRYKGLKHWRVAEAHVRLGATGENIGVLTIRLERVTSPWPWPSGVGTTRGMPLDELYALLKTPRHLIARLFPHTRLPQDRAQ